MQRASQQNPSLNDLLRTMGEHPRRWIIPTLALAALATAFAIVRSESWQASQAMIVRDEAVGSSERPGKFRHVDEMKTLQETVLEMAKNHEVLAGALVEAGPAEVVTSEAWPTEHDVAALQSAIKVSPPSGAEFGTTEMFYLHVQAQTRERSIALAAAVAHQLQIHCQQLRETKADSVIDELNRTVELAHHDLNQSTAQLAAIEISVGRDLAELRILQESPSGDSQLRRTVTELENELRQVRAAQEVHTELLAILENAKQDSNSLLAAPTKLLESQPALRRLKEGLVDAQLRTAQLLGTMSGEHPQVVAAIAAEREVRDSLHKEVDTAIRGVQVDQRVSTARLASLEAQLEDACQRMNRLASVRAEYANLVAEAKQRTDNLRAAERDLSDARAGQAAARAVSLINTVGTPVTGTGPVGPGRALIVLCGLAGGLLIGIAIVFLTAESTKNVTNDGYQEAASLQVRQSDMDSYGNLSLKDALKKVSRRKAALN